MNIFFLLSTLGVHNHNHTCSNHYDLTFDTTLTSSQFCSSRNYYIHHICYSLSHGNFISECTITGFNGSPCINGVCFCFSGNQSWQYENITLSFHLCQSNTLNLSGIPPYIQLHPPNSPIEDHLLSVILTALGILMSLYFALLICKLYLKYMGYQKINLPKNVEEEKTKGARTHDLEDTLEVQP
jgi:hypothetical protein